MALRNGAMWLRAWGTRQSRNLLRALLTLASLTLASGCASEMKGDREWALLIAVVSFVVSVVAAGIAIFSRDEERVKTSRIVAGAFLIMSLLSLG